LGDADERKGLFSRIGERLNAPIGGRGDGPERRVDARVEVRLPVEVKGTDGRVCQGRTVNLSGTGLCLEADLVWKEGVQLELLLPDLEAGSTAIPLRAQVIWAALYGTLTMGLRLLNEASGAAALRRYRYLLDQCQKGNLPAAASEVRERPAADSGERGLRRPGVITRERSLPPPTGDPLTDLNQLLRQRSPRPIRPLRPPARKDPSQGER
jgi:hypothetical protein